MGGSPQLYGMGLYSQLDAQSQAAAQEQMLRVQNAAMNLQYNLVNSQMQSAGLFNSGVRGVDMRPVPTVASTAASRVRKPDWELDEDRKDRELAEFLEKSRAIIAASQEVDSE